MVLAPSGVDLTDTSPNYRRTFRRFACLACDTRRVILRRWSAGTEIDRALASSDTSSCTVSVDDFFVAFFLDFFVFFLMTQPQMLSAQARPIPCPAPIRLRPQ